MRANQRTERSWWPVAAAAVAVILGGWAAPVAAPMVAPMVAQVAAQEDAGKKKTADVVYVATPHDVVSKMLEMAKVTKDDVVYDLGCGDGRFIVTAAKKTGCKGRGYDLDPARVAESKENAKKAKVESRVEIFQQDIFEVDLTPASVITLYLLPRLNQQLIPQLEKMKAGTRIVCHDFEIPGIKSERIIKLTSREDGVEHRILFYTIPFTREEP